jgi:hypothetical protein
VVDGCASAACVAYHPILQLFGLQCVERKLRQLATPVFQDGNVWIFPGVGNAVAMGPGDLFMRTLQLAFSALAATAFRDVLVNPFAAITFVEAGHDSRTIRQTGTDRAGKKGEHQFAAARISATALDQKQSAQIGWQFACGPGWGLTCRVGCRGRSCGPLIRWKVG